ncbi:MFS transporter [Amycolatopsis ultiminotia]|uniref:MFS transporter n=1 Tax=Amycolatopsis ultiminotia TaxID=543629 RepID=A0ABP6XX88_9PSEU
MNAVTTLAPRRWKYIIPAVMVMYLLAYLDRGNVAIILPYIGDGLRLSDAAQGLTSGIFFLGYLILQVPAVVLARRWGARPVITFLLTGWSVAAVLCGLVQNDVQLYVARFVLGVFEGGVLPVTLLLLTRWFADGERVRANTLFLTCLPLSAVLSPPFTGWLLTFVHWRTVFVIEGIVPLVWLVPLMLILRERPAQASWLDRDAAAELERIIASEQAAKTAVVRSSYRQVLRSRLVWQLIAIYFLWTAGAYGLVLWLPTVLKGLASQESSSLQVGLLSSIPYLVALAGMLVWSRWGRAVPARTATALPLLVAGVALALGQVSTGGVLQIVLLCIVAAGGYLTLGTFLAIPSLMFPEAFTVVAIAAMTTLGGIGGFAGPFLVGWVSGLAGATSAGLYTLAACFLLSGLLSIVTIPRRPQVTTTPSESRVTMSN